MEHFVDSVAWWEEHATDLMVADHTANKTERQCPR